MDKEGLQAAPNPLTTDAQGRFRFFVRNGSYDLCVSGKDVDYTLEDVLIMDPAEPHTIHSSPEAPALALAEKAEKTEGGNTALLFNRPGSVDRNNPPIPYRVIVNKGELGWALTWNVDWDELAGKWTKRDLPHRTFFFRINGLDQAIEYGNDFRSLVGPPVMETLFRMDRTGSAHVKAQRGTVSIEVVNDVNVNGKLADLQRCDVVVLDPIRPFTVIAPRRHADQNPVIVTGVNPEDKARVYVLIAGRQRVQTPYTRQNLGEPVKGGAPLVTEGAGSLRAVVGKSPADPRTVLGWLESESNGFIVIVP
jgi:hypothetical protein